tara:strand:- start:138 stop:560 length:423 start_codon:yes stop_codon:yes gene_type:complete
MNKILVIFVLIFFVSCDYPLPEDLQFDGADYVLQRLDLHDFTNCGYLINADYQEGSFSNKGCQLSDKYFVEIWVYDSDASIYCDINPQCSYQTDNHSSGQHDETILIGNVIMKVRTPLDGWQVGEWEEISDFLLQDLLTD